MKKTGIIIVTAAILMIIAIQVNAQNTVSANQTGQKGISSASGNFIDKNNDGVCDKIKMKPGGGRGRNYMDKDGDGICDKRTNDSKKPGNTCKNGQGNQHRGGQGHGRGCGTFCRR